MAHNNDVFCILVVEDKLDGTNYPLWSYMMHHVLVAKGLWNIVAGIDVRPASRAKNASTVVDEARTSTTSTTQIQVVESPTQDQRSQFSQIFHLSLFWLPF